MKPERLVILAVALLAIALAATFGRGEDEDDPGGAADAPSGAIRVSFGYSPEKEALLEPLIEDFNRSAPELAGRKVFIDAQVISSGEAETKLATRRLKLTAWSPASSLWGRLLNFESDREYVAAENPSIVRTPLVIAMWEPMARAIGWPRKRIGFGDILELARDEQGWGRFGRPEFGPFKLVHTNPDYSTSGLSAVVAEYYAATGKREGLTVGDVTASRARATVRAIERSIVHYGDTTLFIADQMRKEGPAYASAVAMEEATLLDFNRRRGGQPRLIALYPRDGTFYSDNPFLILDAPWVSQEQARAARHFQAFLAERITPEVAAMGGFRPADPDEKAVAPVNAQNGADPSQPERVLGLPEPRVLSRIKSTWRADRKPAKVLLVIDTSGSMQDHDRLARAQEGLRTFLREVGRQDRIGITAFSSEVRSLVPVGGNRTRLRQVVDGLIADGDTRLYDATLEAVADVRRQADGDHINAVVLLTDGEDTGSSRTAPELLRALEAQAEGEPRIRVFTIAYGDAAAGDVLAAIAAATGGNGYTSGEDDIEAVYRSISSFF